MYLRDLPGTTLAEFADQVNDTSEANQVSPGEIRLSLTQDVPTVAIGTVEVPASREGLEAMGRLLNVPPTFLYPSDRAADMEEIEYVLGRRLGRYGDAISIHHNASGIKGVYKPGQQPINPRRVVEVAMRVMDPNSPLIEYRASADEMFFDVTVPFENLTTGDPAVGDLTAAGLRFTQNRARNLTPTVDDFMYRLICTNGMSTPERSNRVDARQVETVDDVLNALEIAAREAFSRVEQKIEHFYDLRNQPVDNADRTLRRMALEQGLPERTISRMLDRIPAEVPDGEQANMFHLVNIITNEANNPVMAGRSTSRRSLEVAGGQIIAAHAAERCAHCAQRVN